MVVVIFHILGLQSYREYSKLCYNSGVSTIIILKPLHVVFKASTITLRVWSAGRCGGVAGDALAISLHLGSSPRNLGSKTTL